MGNGEGKNRTRGYPLPCLLPSRIDTLKVRLSALDEKGEDDDLSEAELDELHGVSYDILSLSKLHASISWQQSRSLWLKEGD
ncbi:cysteine-rich receptor-like protein kinase, partial [Trifolium pratense]